MSQLIVLAGTAEFATREDARERIAAAQRPPVETNLAPAPRRIPTSFLLAEMLPWSWWAAFVLLMMGTAPIAVWMMVPKVAPIAGLAAFAVLAVLHFRNTRKRFALLRSGVVAKVMHSDETSRGTYYSGTTYNNMKIPYAHGWKVTRDFYSGPKVVARVRYNVDGAEGELKLGGRGYSDGVILAHPGDVKLALCVTSFPYDLDRDASGNWVGTLRTGLVVGMCASVVFYGAWLAVVATMAHRYW